MTSESSASPASTRTKKLPFKPTALRRVPPPQPAHAPRDAALAAVGDDDGNDKLALFRRTKEMEPIVAADQERRLRKKHRLSEKRRRLPALGQLEDDDDDDDDDGEEDTPLSHPQHRIQGKHYQQRSAIYGGDEPDVGPPASKRSRIDDPGSSERHASSLDKRPVAPVSSPTTSLLRPSPRLDTSDSSADGPTATPFGPRDDEAIICLESDGEDEDAVEATTGHTPGSASLSEEDGEAPLSPADDEFGEYVRKAAEQRDRDRALIRTESDGAPKPEAANVLVTSSVPNAVPCRFRFLFDKPLRMIRDCWVDLQRKKGVPLSWSHDDDVVLTWRRNKVYGSSTLLSLGIRPRGRGRVRFDGPRRQTGSMDPEAGIHMEAWTLDLFHQMERREETRRKRKAGALSGSDDDADGDKAAPAASSAQARSIRLILKARALPDVRLTARPENTVETLLTGFRTQTAISPDRDVSLWFDGERLDEHMTVEAAEMDDLDTLEVHLK